MDQLSPSRTTAEDAQPKTMPKADPVASAGSVITSTTYQQDKVDPLKVVAVVTEKLNSEIAAEQAAAQLVLRHLESLSPKDIPSARKVPTVVVKKSRISSHQG